ncbi:MAG: glycosyltransferase [Planctomycetota bacterium]|nr:glycosyltransferase [Planctomycetota bacterium]
MLRVITRLNRGGPLRQLTALVPGLAARGWDGPVLAGITESGEPDGSEDLKARGADVQPLPELRRGLDPRADTRALRALVRWIRRIRPDVLHTHMGKAGALGRAAARLTGVRVVHTLHGHHLDEEGLLGRGTRAAERVLGRLGDALVCLSASQRDDVVVRHRVVPGDRVHVIEPGFDVEGFREAAGPRPEKPPAEPLQLLWTGRFVDVKRPLALLDVVAAMQTPVTLTALGEGPLRTAFLAAAEVRGLTKRVHAPGAVTDVAPQVARADALVLTSRSEGVPLSVLEAMVVGTPVVVPAVGGLVDVVTDGETGRLAPAGDDAALATALDALAADPDARAALAARARTMACARFAAERLADETAALYGRLAARS